jgi:hypothetical protein
MGPETLPISKPTAAEGDRLDSWKQIAAQLNRDVRTVQRWESGWALPVHRLPGGPKAGVFAFRSELDQWLSGRLNRNSVAAAISPDGRTLAFLAASDQDTKLTVWTASPPDGPPHLYQTLPIDAAGYRNLPQLVFSPDGQEILVILTLQAGNQYWLLPSPPDKPRRLC